MDLLQKRNPKERDFSLNRIFRLLIETDGLIHMIVKELLYYVKRNKKFILIDKDDE